MTHVVVCTGAWPIGDFVPVKPGAVITVGELKQALSSELESLERQKTAVGETRQKLGWRDSVHYLRGNTEAGYPARSGDEALLARAREAMEGQAAANARSELSHAKSACELVAYAVQAHNRRVEQQGLVASVIFSPSNYWRAVKLEKQRQAAQQRLETAENDLARCAGGLESSEIADRVASLAARYRMHERDMAVRRQSVEMRRAILVDELALRRRMLNALAALPEELRIPVRQRELSAVIKDPAFSAWLRGVESNRE